MTAAQAGLAETKVVVNANVMAAREEQFDGMRANIASAAGDENAHACVSLRIMRRQKVGDRKREIGVKTPV